VRVRGSIAAVLGVAAVVPAAPAGAQAPERAHIAYALSASNGHSELYVMRSDGSDVAG
jgi:hypothetical protein